MRQSMSRRCSRGPRWSKIVCGLLIAVVGASAIPAATRAQVGPPSTDKVDPLVGQIAATFASSASLRSTLGLSAPPVMMTEENSPQYFVWATKVLNSIMDAPHQKALVQAVPQAASLLANPRLQEAAQATSTLLNSPTFQRKWSSYIAERAVWLPAVWQANATAAPALDLIHDIGEGLAFLGGAVGTVVGVVALAGACTELCVPVAIGGGVAAIAGGGAVLGEDIYHDVTGDQPPGPPICSASGSISVEYGIFGLIGPGTAQESFVTSQNCSQATVSGYAYSQPLTGTVTEDPLTIECDPDPIDTFASPDAPTTINCWNQTILTPPEGSVLWVLGDIRYSGYPFEKDTMCSGTTGPWLHTFLLYGLTCYF